MERPACNLFGQASAVPLFSSRDYELHISPEEFTLVRCSACGLAYLSPRPDKAEIAHYYPTQYYADRLSHYAEDTGVTWTGRLKKWVRIHYWGWPADPAEVGLTALVHRFAAFPFRHAAAVIPYREGARVLDVGCGNGTFLKRLRGLDPGLELSGLEPGDGNDDFARFGIRRIAARIDEAQLERESFDVITAWDVIEHLHDPLEAATKIHQALRPGGHFVLATPDLESLAMRLFRGQAFHVAAPRHLYLFDRRTLARLLTKAGFREVKVVRAPGGTNLAESYRIACRERGRSHSWPVERFLRRLDQVGLDRIIKAVATK